MKKVKIMLLSMALIAIIGGALAFKARFHSTYCTISAQWDANLQTYTFHAGDVCTTTTNVTTTLDAINPVFYTPKPAGINCNDVRVTCTTFAYTKGDL